jgi:hypothetical protein
MTERQIQNQIRQIASESLSFSGAIEGLMDSLEGGLGGRVLLVGVPDDDSYEGQSLAYLASRFIEETARMPLRSRYTVPLRADGQELGTLTIFLALDYPDEGLYPEEGMIKRLATFAGEQLGDLLCRVSAGFKAPAYSAYVNHWLPEMQLAPLSA